VAGLCLLFGPSLSLACPICAPGAAPGALESVRQADRVVLARPTPEGRPRLSAVIKGEGRIGDTLDLLIPNGTDVLPATHALVLTRSAIHGGWALLGPLASSRASWLLALSQGPTTEPRTTEDWAAHIRWFLPQLEDPESMVAETAYGEIARAPYAAMRAVRDALDAPRLRTWISAPDKQTRRPLYLLLLGLRGEPGDALGIEGLLTRHDRLTASSERVRNELSALITAALELGGPARLPGIESDWLRPANRSDAEVQQALLALSVHGTEGGRLARRDIVQAYLRFIESRPALGGLVAQDLASWGAWEATPAYAKAILNKDLPIGSRVAMAQYLRVSPHPEARPALLKALGRP
jgi:hypothetical protein